MKPNRTILLLMFSDIFVLTGFGLIDPILAIFIENELTGGSLLTIGVASAVFMICKSLTQLPFSRYVDKHTELNDIRWLIVGTIALLFVPLIYIFSTSVYHVYIAQIIHGVGSGLAYSTWLSLWSFNLDKDQVSFEWSLYSTSVGLGTAMTATIGAFIAEFAGFTTTFTLVGIMIAIGCGILFILRRELVKNFS